MWGKNKNLWKMEKSLALCALGFFRFYFNLFLLFHTFLKVWIKKNFKQIYWSFPLGKLVKEGWGKKLLLQQFLNEQLILMGNIHATGTKHDVYFYLINKSISLQGWDTSCTTMILQPPTFEVAWEADADSSYICFRRYFKKMK